MVKLLIIADDFTGALDTGVQFAAKGAAVRVDMGRGVDYSSVEEGTEVLVLDAETRHLRPEEAYKIVSEAVADARRAGVPFLYKKTDSALRGNIGAELTAMCDMADKKRVHFVPALPGMNRITIGGIHYIDGVPVGDSVFGRDPFEPVRESSVTGIIRAQSKAPVYLIEDGLPKAGEGEGIFVYDAKTDDRLKEIAKGLWAQEELGFCAGCAGFAAVLPKLLGLTGRAFGLPSLPSRLLVACGSVNPITVAQLDYAERAGAPRIRLDGEQKLSARWPEGKEADSCMESWRALCEKHGLCILDSNDEPGDDRTKRYRREHGISLEEARKSIASNMGAIVKGLLDGGLDAALLITGGDTLKGFLEKVGISRLYPICEAAPGAVVSGFWYRSKLYYVISKSGGFGRESLIEDILSWMAQQKEKL